MWFALAMSVIRMVSYMAMVAQAASHDMFWLLLTTSKQSHHIDTLT